MAKSKKPLDPARGGAEKAKIMLVEDDPMQVSMYELGFQNAGYSISTVSKGEIAFAEIKKQKPDLVILDILLGDVSGVDILKSIKGDSETKNIKVIIMSNFTKKSVLEECRQAGALDFLVKSKYIPAEVVKEVEKYL